MGKGANKRCCFGACKSDSRSKSFRNSFYHFLPFPKSCTAYRKGRIECSRKKHVRHCQQCKKCESWVKACRRGDGRFSSIDNVNKDTYICSLHFEEERGLNNENEIPVDNTKKKIEKKVTKRTSLSEKYKGNKEESCAIVSREEKSHVMGQDCNDILQLQEDCNEELSENGAGSVSVGEQPVHIDISEHIDVNGFVEEVTVGDRVQTKLQGEDISEANCIEEGFGVYRKLQVQDEEGRRLVVVETRGNCTQTEIETCDNFCATDSLKTRNKRIQVNFPEHNSMKTFEKSVASNEKQCLFYTNLRYDQVISLHKFLSPQCENLNYWGSQEKSQSGISRNKQCNKLTSLQQLLLVLIRLRAGLLTEDLSYRFDISVGLISKICTTWIQFLYNEFTVHLKPLMFPSRHIVKETLPQIFKSMKNIRVIIDCTEFYCQSPMNFEQQGNLYSAYKAHSTFKVLIGSTPNGSICFVSDAFEGSISDREIVIQSKFADHLEPGDLVLADRGFTVHDVIESKKASLSIPPFLNDRNRLTPQEEMLTKRIAKQRIYIEHIVGRIKNFRILQREIPLNMRGLMSQIVFVCGCLVNFQTPIVFDDDIS